MKLGEQAFVPATGASADGDRQRTGLPPPLHLFSCFLPIILQSWKLSCPPTVHSGAISSKKPSQMPPMQTELGFLSVELLAPSTSLALAHSIKSICLPQMVPAARNQAPPRPDPSSMAAPLPLPSLPCPWLSPGQQPAACPALSVAPPSDKGTKPLRPPSPRSSSPTLAPGPSSAQLALLTERMGLAVSLPEAAPSHGAVLPRGRGVSTAVCPEQGSQAESGPGSQ